MKYGIHILLVVLTLSLIQQQAISQKTNKLDKISEHLSLTDEQKSDITELFEEQKESMESLAEDATREDKKEIRDAFKSKLSNILTEEQLTKWENANHRKRGYHKGKGKTGHRAKHSHHGRLEGKRTRTLTDEQMDKIREARTDFEQKISEEDKVILEEMRGNFQALKESMKDAKDSKNKEDWKLLKSDLSEAKSHLKDLSIKYKDAIKESLASIRTKNVKIEKRENKGRKEFRRGHRGHRKIGRFLLMDPTLEVSSSDLSTTKQGPVLNISPNPAVGQTDIQYTIQSQGLVTIDLRSEQGDVIATFVQEQTEKGSYTIQVDLSTYQGKSYFITITDSHGMATEKLLIVK